MIKHKIKILLELIKYLFFLIVDFFLTSPKNHKENSILIIKMDAIGDYILFRNFLYILKSSITYKNYKITLVGNVVWKEIAETFDKDIIDDFIWIDRKKFTSNIFYRFKMLKRITSNSYEVVIQPSYSRFFLEGDSIVKYISAKKKIGSEGDVSNLSKFSKSISDKYYTSLVKTDKKILFEFDRNKEFFTNICSQKLKIKLPKLSLKKYIPSLPLPENYVILFIGASSNSRKWSPEKYLDIAKFLINNYGYNVVICGAPSDISDAQIICSSLENSIINMVGKTSLVDLIFLIKSTKFVISNETSIPHIAVALGIPVIIIYNGIHFGRFTPYPVYCNTYFTVYHPRIEKDLMKYKRISNGYMNNVYLNINDISTDKLYSAILRLHQEIF